MKREIWLFFIFFLGFIFLGFLLLKPRIFRIEKKSILTTSQNVSSLKEEKIIKVVLTGDIMLERGVKLKIDKYGQGDFKFPFLKIAAKLEGADIVFGNLEGPISDKGIKVGSIYSFRNEIKAIEGLTFAGFNVLSLANNHTLDYSLEALKDTFLRLKTAGIEYVGAGFNEKEAFSPLIKEIETTKIAFLAYTDLGPKTWKAIGENSGIAWISENDFEKIKNDIKSAKEISDILIVSLHSGEEYQKKPTKFQKEFSKMAIDAGADIVVGHHAHLVQAGEKYKDGWIFYSLGNFVFDQSFSKETMGGQIIEIIIQNKKIQKVIPINIKINEFFQPEIENE